MTKLTWAVTAAAIWTLGSVAACAGPTNNSVYPIDLPTVLRLAGAQNLDVQIARQRLAEAKANQQSASEQLLPWIAPGVNYHRRDGMAQAVPAGTVSDTHFQSYAVGGTLSAQLALGDSIYQVLASKQLTRASGDGVEAERLDSSVSAAQAYFELAKTKGLAAVIQEAVDISEDYRRQLHEAVAAGIAFRGDELRVETQTQNYQVAQRQTIEQQRTASVHLAQVLHLDSTIELLPRDEDLLPLTLVPTNAPLDGLVQRALQQRPELRQSQALVRAARFSRTGAAYGPLIPSLGAQVFAGGFGGAHDDGPSNFGDSEDYLVGLSWRLGPGGLFDFGRINASKARLAIAELDQSKLKDAVMAQVVSGLSRVQSLSDQIALAQRRVATASETLQLTRQRKQFGVGAVLEDIQAQQELAKARSDLLNTVAEFNKAQYALKGAIGSLE